MHCGRNTGFSMAAEGAEAIRDRICGGRNYPANRGLRPLVELEADPPAIFDQQTVNESLQCCHGITGDSDGPTCQGAGAFRCLPRPRCRNENALGLGGAQNVPGGVERA
jgi:hypothetical protein